MLSFFKKKQPEDSTEAVHVSGLGDFMQFRGEWICEIEDPEFGIVVLTINTEYGPFDENAAVAIRNVVSNLKSVNSRAMGYWTEKATESKNNYGEISLFSVRVEPTDKNCDFILSYNFSDWEDGGLFIDFRDDRPIRYLCCD